MPDLPPHHALAGLDRTVLFGLLTVAAAPALDASYEHSWERERALIEAVDAALCRAAEQAGQAVQAEAAPAPKPRWLDGLVRRELERQSQTSWARNGFIRVRLLERLGLVDLEPDDTYVLAMVSGLGPGKVAKLKADPCLLEHVLWRVFEVEGGGEVSLTNIDRFGQDGWCEAFLDLTAAGILDRSRVLTACLDALRRDFLAYRARWYSATFLAFEPTVDELAEYQDSLRRLLGSDVPATVAFAVKLLLRLQKAGRLETGEALAALSPATLVKPKGTVLDALRLAKACGATHRAAVAEVARAALVHEHPDVQRAAADLLATLGESDVVSAAAEELAPSVRQDLRLGSEAGIGPDEKPEQPLAPVPDPVTAADLAERVAALLEDTSDTGELEAVLAALARPGNDERLAPLRKRAEAIVRRGLSVDRAESLLPNLLARLMLGLLGIPLPVLGWETTTAHGFLIRRFAELRHGSGPLLATPDLPGGWVSPSTLVARLEQSPVPRHHDVIAALLRLHPDGREKAVREGLPAAVRFALDGSGGPNDGRREDTEAWWVAAERSRGPYGDDETPQLHSEIQVHTWNEHGREHRRSHGKFALSIISTRKPAGDLPTELDADIPVWWGRFVDGLPALASIWPHDAEHFLALTCGSVLDSPASSDATHEVPRVLDALARHPGRLGSLATHTLAAGLSAGRRDYRLHAVDAFLDLVPTGRIAASDLATVLATFSRAWPSTRWTESLRSAGQGPGGGAAVIAVLTALLPQLPLDTRGLNGLLGLLRDESIRHGRPIADPALVGWLRQHTGSSSAAKTARLLLG